MIVIDIPTFDEVYDVMILGGDSYNAGDLTAEYLKGYTDALADLSWKIKKELEE